MSRTRKSAKSYPPVVSPRERQLLDELERLKSCKTRLTVVSFSKHVGYANKSARRHFPVLRHELSLYVKEFAQPGVKVNDSTATKYFEVQIERQSRLINRLRLKAKKVPKLEAQIVGLQSRAKKDSNERIRLRAMLSTVIAFLTNSDFAKARDLSTRIEELARELLEDA